MAVRHGYGKVAGADALVFAYDTGDTVNSYRGMPTTNQATLNLANWINEGATRNLQSETFNGNPVYQWKSNDGQIWISPFAWNNIDLKNNDCTVSAYFKNTSGNTETVGMYFGKDFSTDAAGNSNYRSIPVDGQWHRHSWTMYADVNLSNYLEFRTSSNTMLITTPMVNYGRIAAQPVEGTRSVTQGLLDLIGNVSIDISNMSFDDSANLLLDGTDDRIFAGNPSELSLHNGIATFEAVVKFPKDWTGGSQYPNLICKGARAGWDTPGWALFGFRDWPNANNKSWGLGLRNDAGSVRTVAKYDSPTDVYLHLVATMDGTTMKLYENGILVNTNTQTVNPAENDYNVFVGGDDGSNRFPGELPIVKVYNKALTQSEVVSNFKHYRNRFKDLSNYYDNETDGGRWIRFWWYTGVGWPGHETEALGHPFGTFDSSSHYGFQRLPEGLEKEQVELLAKDGDGNIYKWDFGSSSATAERVWNSFTTGAQGSWNNGGAWNPTVIEGSFFNTNQDAWQYRDSEGVVSFLLDDDTCDCKSTLNAGHAMCGAGWNQTYAQPDGAYQRYGVDTLNDGGCLGPVPERTLELYYRLK